MSTTRATPTIFLSYSAAEGEFAREVDDVLTRAGAKVWKVGDIATSGGYTNEVRRSLDRSAGVVVVLGNADARREVPANVLFEIGAATGARKPVFVVVEVPTSRVPFNVPDMYVIPFNRVEEIPRLISNLGDGLSVIRPTG